MPIVRIHFHADDGGDAGAAETSFGMASYAASHASNAIMNSSTPWTLPALNPISRSPTLTSCGK